MPGSGYQEDVATIITKQAELIKRQVLLEIITIACESDDFDQFKKVLYARALGFMKEFEDQGMLKKGTTEKVAKGGKLEESDEIPESERPSKKSAKPDDGILY
jgi:hypothetical protein